VGRRLSGRCGGVEGGWERVAGTSHNLVARLRRESWVFCCFHPARSLRPLPTDQANPLRPTTPPTASKQDEGNYRVAHSKLLKAVQQIEALGGRAPRDLVAALTLLHSYVLVHSLIAVEDHLGAARMLVRVAGSISR